LSYHRKLDIFTMPSQVRLHARAVEEKRDLTFFILKSMVSALALFAATALHSQNTDFDLQRILTTSSVEGFREEVRAYIAKNKGTPLSVYLDALSQTDASVAVEKYRQLTTVYPNSEYADRAQLRVAQYYFSRGLYVAARKHFLELVEKYPKSPHLEEALYFAAAGLHASGTYDSAASEFKNLLMQYPNSRFVSLIKEDLQESNYSVDSADNKNTKLDPRGKYSLQIGAFSQVNNALTLKNYCTKLGFPAEVREKQESRSNVYLVWLGSFETQEDAERFGETFKREHGKPYRIVAR
jgi:tetratricopeptide (TPR) repeat protein